jgi:hypothetical protein
MANLWNALSGEWRALPDIAKHAGVTESEAVRVLAKYLRQKKAERKLGEIERRASTWYRRV